MVWSDLLNEMNLLLRQQNNIQNVIMKKNQLLVRSSLLNLILLVIIPRKIAGSIFERGSFLPMKFYDFCKFCPHRVGGKCDKVDSPPSSSSFSPDLFD